MLRHARDSIDNFEGRARRIGPRNRAVLKRMARIISELAPLRRVIPLAKRLGSNDGWLTIARMSPVLGSIATNAPERVPIACSATCCTSRSSVKTTLCPGVSGISRSSEPAPY